MNAFTGVVGQISLLFYRQIIYIKKTKIKELYIQKLIFIKILHFSYSKNEWLFERKKEEEEEKNKFTLLPFSRRLSSKTIKKE